MNFKLTAQVLLVSLAVATMSHGQSSNDRPIVAASADRSDDNVATPGVMSGAANSIDFILRGIDDQTRDEFQKAWLIAKGGVESVEGVVLLYRGRNGSLIAKSQGCTNERLSYSFKWSAAIIGVVHTHPNFESATPSGEDLRIADRFHVPVFTITNRGMFVYDPATKKMAKVFDGLAWLKPSKQPAALKR